MPTLIGFLKVQLKGRRIFNLEPLILKQIKIQGTRNLGEIFCTCKRKNLNKHKDLVDTISKTYLQAAKF